MVRYEIDYWDEDTGERKHERGLVSIQGTIGNHVDHLYDYFGKDNVIEAKIYMNVLMFFLTQNFSKS